MRIAFALFALAAAQVDDLLEAIDEIVLIEELEDKTEEPSTVEPTMAPTTETVELTMASTTEAVETTAVPESSQI